MTDWVRVRSWHIEVTGDQLRTLCGLRVRAHPEPGEHQAQGWSGTLPADGKSCESCARLMIWADERVTR